MSISYYRLRIGLFLSPGYIRCKTSATSAYMWLGWPACCQFDAALSKSACISLTCSAVPKQCWLRLLTFPSNIRSKFRSPLAASSVDASSFLALLGFLHLLLQLGDVLLILSHLLLVVGGCGNVFGCRTAMPLFYTHRRYVMRSMIIITLHMVNGSLTQRNLHYYPWMEHPLLLQLTSLLLLIPLCAVNNFAIAVAIATLRNEQFRHRGCDSHFAQWTISWSRLR